MIESITPCFVPIGGDTDFVALTISKIKIDVENLLFSHVQLGAFTV